MSTLSWSFFCSVSPASREPGATWEVDHQSRPFLLPSIGGITLNVQVGGPVSGWAGDHVDPGLLGTLGITERSGGVLDVSVATVVSAVCMGAGVGSVHVAKGDYDIMTGDPETVDHYDLRRTACPPGADIADLLGIGRGGNFSIFFLVFMIWM